MAENKKFTAAEYRAAMVQLLTVLGFQKDPDYGANTYEFVGMTVVGVLRVSIMERETPQVPHWLACRFDDPREAVKVADILGDRLNPNSGKWNWDNGWSDAEAFTQAVQRIGEAGVRVGPAHLPRRCPCCGCAAHHRVGNKAVRMPDEVECLGCGLKISEEYDAYAALFKWNKRVTP